MMKIKIIPVILGAVVTAAALHLIPPSTVYIGEGNGHTCKPGYIYGSTCYKYNSRNDYDRSWAFSKVMTRKTWIEYMRTYESGFR